MRFALICLVFVLTSCGSSEPTFTSDSVSEMMSDAIRDGLPDGMTIDPLECVQDGDEFHYRCRTYALRGEERYTVSVQITCDPNSGQCLSEPASIFRA